MANSARIDELRKKFDENPRRYFAPLANEYRKSGDLPQAVFILEEYLPQQPGHISGHIVYGQTLFELGRDEEAKRVFETALSLDPENLIALRHLGHISRQAGEFDAARTWYQRLLEADPRDAEIEQLLGSLDSAAQAQAASMARPAPVDSVPPPLPPPRLDEPDDSPLQVEHTIQQDAPGAPPRASTHPLAPPPISFSSSASDVAAPASEAADSSPAPVAQEEQQGEPEPAEELLDLSDFSFDAPAAPPPPLAAMAADEPQEAEQVAATADLSDDIDEPVASTPHEPVAAAPHEDVAWQFAASPSETVEAREEEPATSESAPAVAELTPAVAESAPPATESTPEAAPPAAEPAPEAASLAFESVSSPDSQTPQSESNVNGLESYTFEAPQGPVAEQSEDVGSFYMMAPVDEAPPEPVEPAEGFESVEMEFAADVSAAVTESESYAHDEPARVVDAEPVAMASEPEADRPEHEEIVARAATPVATTPVASRTPAAAATAAPDDTDGDTFATETMAKLYLSQGHLESALGIYRTLSDKRPDDASLRRHIEEIEDRVQRRRREPTPPTPIDTTIDVPIGAMSESVAAPRAAETGPTIRDFLVGILRRGGTSATSGTAPSNGGTIDALFGGAGTLDDDLAAADTLARAFAPEPEKTPMQGKPAREASTELSLDHVFRQPSAAHASERASGDFSFDQFFAGEVNESAGATETAAPGDPEDIEQFNAWLNGLKKS